jgi:two-component system, LytTR family, sensor kinase
MRNKILWHLIYWILTWFLTNLLFGYAELFNPASMLYSSVILLIAAGVSYWIVYFLIPRYLTTGKYGLFLTYLLFTIITSLDLELLTTMLFIIFLEKFQVITFYHDAREVYSLLTGTYFIVFLSVAIKLVEFWYHEQHRKQSAITEKIEAELKLLKSQIHPHFLFNTLNNIYSLSLQKSDQAPDAVLKLSELLDYLIYHGESKIVELKKETDLIRNYIELENLRYGDRLTVDFHINGNPENIRIAPLLLLPLVENSFKHGISKSRGNQQLTIKLEIAEKNVEFYIENTVPIQTKKETVSGIGLPNLQKRLALQYKDKHSLEIRDDGTKYLALLKIET